MPGAFLDGAAEGIKNYLIKWDSTTLSDPMMWTKAIGQVCFRKLFKRILIIVEKMSCSKSRQMFKADLFYHFYFNSIKSLLGFLLILLKSWLPRFYSWTCRQVFFSLGVCMGVMTAYSSHNSKTKTNVAMSEKAISLRYHCWMLIYLSIWLNLSKWFNK